MSIKLVIDALVNGLKGFSFDWLIILVFIYNSVKFFFLKKNVYDLYDVLSGKNLGKYEKNEEKSKVRIITGNNKQYTESQWWNEKEKINKRYTVFLNITQSFPLLGMLGTVMALIPMVQEIGVNVQTNFFAALTSTFWGIVFSIVSKVFFDSLVSDKIEKINSNDYRPEQETEKTV